MSIITDNSISSRVRKAIVWTAIAATIIVLAVKFVRRYK